MSIFRQAENVFNGVFHQVKNGVQSVNFQALMFVQGQFQPSHELFSKDRLQVLLLAEHCLQSTGRFVIQHSRSMSALLQISYLLVEGL